MLLQTLIIIISCCWVGQDDVPYRDKETYEFTIDYNFKNKPPGPKNHVSFTEPASNGTALLPYLKVHLNLLEIQPDDFRIKIVNVHGVVVTNKKLKEPMELIVDMGFTEDLIDRITPHLYHFYFLNADKEITSQLVLEVSKSGEMLINKSFFGQL